MENTENTVEQPTVQSTGKIEWSPEADITIKGIEFDAFTNLLELYEIPPAQLSPAQLYNYFARAKVAARDILLRMKEQGVAIES